MNKKGVVAKKTKKRLFDGAVKKVDLRSNRTSAEEREDQKYLLLFEINRFLRQIYQQTGKKIIRKSVKKSESLVVPTLSPSSIKIILPAIGSTKTFEFKLNCEDCVLKGDVGNIIVSRNIFKDPIHRRQTALFIAAEHYIYTMFARAGKLDQVKNQNQYMDILKKIVGKLNSHDLRDAAIRYVAENISQHTLVSYQPKNWVVSVAKPDKFDKDIADTLKISEDVFHKLIQNQKKKFSPEMFYLEDNLVKNEIADLERMLELFKVSRLHVKEKHVLSLFKLHEANIRTFIKVLHKILINIHKWSVANNKEHMLLIKKVVHADEMKQLLLAESDAQNIDMNKVRILLHHFEKEKINILKDLRYLSV